MNTNFFASSSYFIDEKVNLFKFENCYKIYNDKGDNIGSILQKLTLGQKLLRLLLNKSMLPFKLEIRDLENNMLSSINRGWTFFMSKITIQDPNNKVIGHIQQKFKFLKPTFKIFDAAEQQIAEISGDWKAWNFVIKNPVGDEIGAITKKWAGALKEIFTTADKYNVTLNAKFSNDAAKIVVLSSAITIDMVLKERK